MSKQNSSEKIFSYFFFHFAVDCVSSVDACRFFASRRKINRAEKMIFLFLCSTRLVISDYGDCKSHSNAVECCLTTCRNDLRHTTFSSSSFFGFSFTLMLAICCCLFWVLLVSAAIYEIENARNHRRAFTWLRSIFGFEDVRHDLIELRRVKTS